MLFYNSLLQIYEEFAEYALSFSVFFPAHGLSLLSNRLTINHINSINTRTEETQPQHYFQLSD